MQSNDPTAPKQTAILMQPDAQSLSLLVSILTSLAQARQAPINSETLKLYALKLSRQDLRDVNEAVGKMASQPRREGEAMFLDFRTLLCMSTPEGCAGRMKEERDRSLEDEKTEFAAYVRFRMERRGQTWGKCSRSFRRGVRGYTHRGRHYDIVGSERFTTRRDGKISCSTSRAGRAPLRASTSKAI